MASSAAELLGSIEIFRNLSDGDLEDIGALFKEHHVREGQILVRQGDPGEGLVVIAEGKVRLSLDSDGRENVLAYFEAGQAFGETGLLTGEANATTATAEADCRLLVLLKEDFDDYLLDHVEVRQEIARARGGGQDQGGAPLAGEPEPGGAKQGKVLVVYGPRGGSGKSTIAVNLATALALAHPNEVALVDLSLTFGNCAVMLNLLPKTPLARASLETLATLPKERLSDYLPTHASTLRLMVGASAAEEEGYVTPDHVRDALRLLRRLHDYVVVDTGSNFSEQTIAALETADKVLLVCTPDLITLREVRECQRILSDVIRVASEKVYYVMNNVFPFKALAVDQFVQTLEKDIDAEIPFGNDAPAKAASLRGDPLIQAQANSNVSKAIDRIAKTLETELYPTATSLVRKGLFGR